MLSKFSVKKPYTVIVGIVLVIVLGVVSLTRMTTDLLPSMDLPYAIVMTTYPGASPEEVEEKVSKPIESTMATISNIKNINSISADNYSTVILEFEQTANMDSITIEMRESLDQLTSSFDDAVGSPLIMKLNPDMMPIMIAAADVEGMDSTEITKYVQEELAPEIESLEGVASVSVTGAIEETVQVTLSQDKIDAVNKKIMEALDQSFADAEAEMQEAKLEIEEGKNELESGKNEMANSIGSAQNELNDKKVEMALTEQELNTQLEELRNTKTKVEEGVQGLVKLKEGADTLKKAIDGAAMMPPEQLEAAGVDLEGLQKQYAALEVQAAKIGAAMEKDDLTLNQLPAAIQEMENNLLQVNAGITQIESALASIATGKITINEALAAMNKSQILGSIEMGSANAQLSSGEQELTKAEDTLEESKEEAYEKSSLDNILTMEMLQNILTAQNFSMPAGYIEEKGEEYLVRVGDKLPDVKELKDLILLDMDLDGVEPIKLSDVAKIAMENNEEEVYANINGNPGIILTIEKQTGYATGDVTDKINQRFEELEEANEALHTTVLMDQGIYIKMIVDSVMQNMIFGGLLAVIILLLFLKDLRPTIVIAISIPVSVIFAVVLMYFSGITLNVISLSGLALGIGMLVDNSIVVIENIYRLRNEGYSVKKAAIEGAKQVAGAIAASTLTTICVFAPIIFTEGITRQLFVDMGLTIAYSLLASLVIALTFVPMMAAGTLRNVKEKSHPWFDRVKDWYGTVIETVLRFKWLVFLVVIGLFAGSIYAAMQNGTAFMPEMESEQVSLTLTPPEDTTLKDAKDLSAQVIERLSDMEDIETIGAMTGGGMMSLGGSSGNTISMYLILKESPSLSGSELSEEIMNRTKDIKAEISVSTSSMDMGMLTGSGISVQIKGRDLDKLQKISGDLAQILEDIEGTTDVSDGVDETVPEFRISVDKAKATKYGMTVAQLFQLVNDKVADATSVTTIATDVKDYEVFVSFSEKEDISRKDIQKLTFTYTDKEGEKKEIPLEEVAEFSEVQGLSEISRADQERYIEASAAIADGYNIGLVSDEVQEAINDYDLPDGYTISMTGEDETINEAMGQLYLMLLLAVIFVYMIMVAQFQSLLSPFIIMFTIPLAFTGGFLALFFTGSELSIIAMIGFVMLAGIIVNNGIVMVDYTNQLRREGMNKKEAIIEAGVTRLRPIFMTALTTIIAMSTMALGLDSGSAMMKPMALVVVGGMIYGTILTLVVVPCIYDAFNRNKSMVEEDF